MEFGIKKCGVTVLKRGKLSKTEGIQIVNGETIKEVCEEGYKYLGILKLDKVKEQEMKDIFRNEYMQRLKLVMKSKLNGKNKINAVNTWAVSLLRYGGGVIGWTKEEQQSMDRKTRKVMTMNKELHSRSNTARIYVPRKRGVRGLISCEACVRGEENSLGWYVARCNEVLLRKVGERGTVKTDEAKNTNERGANAWAVC